jgi:hypothetical protein
VQPQVRALPQMHVAFPSFDPSVCNSLIAELGRKRQCHPIRGHLDQLGRQVRHE